MNNLKKAIISLIAIVTMIVQIIPVSAITSIKVTNGAIYDHNQMVISPDTTYNFYDMKIGGKYQQVHYVEFNPNNENMKLQVAKSNNNVYGMQALSGMVDDANAQGKNVVAAINGDLYHMGYGLPIGIFVDNGKILTDPLPEMHWSAFGLKEDNTSIYGQGPYLAKNISFLDKKLKLTHLNRVVYETDSLVLYTDDYYTSTKNDQAKFTDLTGSKEAIDEIVCNVIEGEPRHNEVMKLEVVEVRKGKYNSPIKDGQAVIAATGKYKSEVANLKAGDQIDVSFSFGEGWKNVEIAIGGQAILLENGVVKSDLNKVSASRNPRTAIGTKANGEIVFIVVDGRNSGISEGLTLNELALLMKDMGCVSALNLDGGGSSEFIAKLAGETKYTIVNTPSDPGNVERKVANGLFIVNTSQPSKASQFIVKPNMTKVLVNSSVDLNQVAVDDNYNIVPYSGTVQWVVNSTLGTIDNKGVFKAGTKVGKVEATVTSSDMRGKGEIEVVSNITTIKPNVTSINIASAGTKKIYMSAYAGRKRITCTNSAFQFSVDGGIGTIDKDGLFKASTNKGGTGSINIKYTNPQTKKVLSAKVNVTVGKPPIVIEDFEDGITGYKSSGANYNELDLYEETNDMYVAFGKKSAKLNYDFTGKTGTSGAYIVAKSSADAIKIPDYPAKIGMWIKGDSSGNWLRTQLIDGNNNAFSIDFVPSSTGVNFDGWKYVEAKVPTGKKLPLKMDMPARYMSIKDTTKKSGTIYIDQIRAVYGEVTEDINPPIIKDNYPANNSTIKTNTPEIYATAMDYGYDAKKSPNSTLINPNEIKMYIDDTLVQHELVTTTGKISFKVSTPISDGMHTAKIKVKDNMGNPQLKEWNFNVDTGAARINIEKSQDSIYTGNEFAVNIKGINNSNLISSEMKLQYDKAKLEYVGYDKNSNLQNSNITVTNSEGIVSINLKDIDSCTSILQQDILSTIKFKVKPTATGCTRISLQSGVITSKDSVVNAKFYNLPLNYLIKNKLILIWSQDSVLQGNKSIFTVKDEKGSIVVGASIIDTIANKVLGTTDNKGVVTVNSLANTVKEYKLQAKKDDMYSAINSFVVKSTQIHFKDVQKGFWAEEAIMALAKKGVINGKTETTYAPNDSITRAETIAMLVRFFNFKATSKTVKFNDIKGAEWYADEVKIAASNGIVSGYNDGTFKGNNLISRQELSQMIYNAIKVSGKKLQATKPQSNFTDKKDIATYANEAVYALNKSEIINGYPDGTIKPKNNATRAEVAKMIYVMMNRIK